MKRIDRETVQRILDTADIVDVVSDFVTLKRRGANFIGLCPFHSERTPSFSVSRAKGICKCFSCGKGGSPVNFLMELEQMSFNDALRYLAKKYNIEIKESEVSEAERQEAGRRENMLAVNDAAMKIMADNLTNTDEGRNIGLAYFRERGISDDAIRKFDLGYALERNTSLRDALVSQGYNEDTVIETGLCIKQEDTGRVYDRFRSRVIYPVRSISGRVVAFGGRTLRSDKKVAKYVNSPESVIYSKSRELYGLYQAKSAIARKDKCILVEGYMDVISMYQRGIENVVASSGTSLTEGQIRIIHRFTSNVTLIYDSDAAGIKASLRGVDMLLAEGLKVKVVSLPDGDDPDSFAQAHSTDEIEEYIQNNEVDFIRFKTRILLAGANDDPIRRAEVINDIVGTISVISDEIMRTVYIQECSRMLNIDEKTLTVQVARKRAQNAERSQHDRDKARAVASITDGPGVKPDDPVAQSFMTDNIDSATSEKPNGQSIVELDYADADILSPVEREIVRYILRYGMLTLDYLSPDGKMESIPVLVYLTDEMRFYGLNFNNPVYERIVVSCMDIYSQEWESAYANHDASSLEQRAVRWEEGINEIRATAETLDLIKSRESALQAQVDEEYIDRDVEFKKLFLARNLLSSPDDVVRQTVTDLVAERYILSKVHSKYAPVESEQDRLDERLPQVIYGLRDAHVQCRLRQLRNQLGTLAADDFNRMQEIMREIAQLDINRRELAKQLGERVVIPKSK